LLVAVVALVLLVACANAANLFLARNATRARDILIRRALGAKPHQLARYVLAEATVVVLAATALGVLLAAIATRVLLALQPEPLPGAELVALDARALAFAAALATGSVLLFGGAPALALPGGTLSARAGPGHAGPRARRLRNALIVGQVLVSTLLLVSAALLLRTYAVLFPSDPGFEWRDRLAFRVEFSEDRFPDHDARQRALAALFDQLAGLPGVRSVSAASDLPLTRSRLSPNSVTIGEASAGSARMVHLRSVTPNYLSSMGMRLLGGRGLEPSDYAGAVPVAVINEAMAQYLWRGESPVRQRFRIPTPARGEVELEVVGVVANAWLSPGRTESRPEVFVPYAQEGGNELAIVVSASQPERLALPTAEIARRIVPDAAIVGPNRRLDRPMPLEHVLSDAMAPWRYQAVLVGVFAAVVVVLTAGGLYGVLSLDVARRKHELGVRLALGARPRVVAALVMRQGSRLVLSGLTLGVGVAVSAHRLLASFLYGVSPVDLASYAAAAIGVATIGLASAWLPARRATRVDPLVVLRDS
jgi:putative ABC transport system permease protein